LRYCRADALGSDFIHPDSVIRFPPETFRKRGVSLKSFTTDQPYYWDIVYSAIDQRKCNIPAQFIYAPFTPLRRESTLWVTSTSGVAAGEELWRHCPTRRPGTRRARRVDADVVRAFAERPE
jgi:YcaO cyclodehydratase, ATP-ad Mg2+-binding